MGETRHRAQFYAPPPALAGCFTSFYLLETDLAPGEWASDCLHPEWGNLRFFLGPAAVTTRRDKSVLADTPFTATGPSSCPIAFRLPRTRMWGIGILPLGWARFMDVPAATLADTVNDGMTHPAFAAFRGLYDALRDAAGDEAAEAEVIAAWFLARARPAPHAARIGAIHAALVDPETRTVGQLADRGGVTGRTLERICSRYFGFAPQHLIRRQRMMRTLAAFMLADKAHWSEVIDCNYTDQAHFTHEFHAFMGMSPSEFAAREHPILAAFMAERARVLGSPVQTLDRPAAAAAVAIAPARP